MTDFNKIKELNGKIAELIDKRPQLRFLQMRINKAVEGKTPLQRYVIVNELLAQKTAELMKKITELNEEVRKCQTLKKSIN
jgi:hypothetical protein